MKIYIFLVLVACLSSGFTKQTVPASNTSINATDTSARKLFTEGIFYTRISFPGNIMNEALAKIDFEKGDLQKQLQHLQTAVNSKEYAAKAEAHLKTMTVEERTAMGSMMMGIMMSPLYAKIYYSNDKILAKANALTYSMESFMNTSSGDGKMVVMANDKSDEAAIKFSAGNMRQVWEKEDVNAERYDMKPLVEQEMVAGYRCKKIEYTHKEESGGKTMLTKPAYKLIVWYSPDVSDDINFLHPFYFQLDKGILKIEVHYDKKGKNKMLYEVTRTESKRLTETDFSMTDISPVIDWDTAPAEASVKMLTVMMSSAASQ